MAGTLSKPFSVTKAADQSENIDQMFYELYQTVKELSASLTTVTKATSTPASSGSSLPRFSTISPYSGDTGVLSRTLPTSGISGIGGPFTQGSMIFAGPSGLLAQNNANIFWDNVTALGLGIGTTTIDPIGINTRLRLVGNATNVSAQLDGNTADADATIQTTFAFGAISNTLASDIRIAIFRGVTDGTTANNRGGRFTFFTKGDGAGLTEQLRIDQAGLTWAKTAFAVGGTPATAGGIRAAYGSVYIMRDRTNDANITLLGMGSVADDDFIEVGDNSQHGVTKPLGFKFYPGAAVKMVLFTSGGLNLGATSDPGAGNFSIASPGTLTLAAMSAKSILFAGTSGVVTQDNANFSYDNSTATMTVVGSGGRCLKLGTNSAGSGFISMQYAAGLVARARLNASDIALIGVGGVADDDYIELGDNSQHAVSKPLGIKFYPGSGNKLQLDTNGLFTMFGTPKFGGTNSTGTGSASLSTNCPAVTPTAPYTWITANSSDGSTVFIPCWK